MSEIISPWSAANRNNFKKLRLSIGGVSYDFGSVPILTDDLKFSFSYQHDFDPAFDKVKENFGGGILNKATELLDMARAYSGALGKPSNLTGGKFMSKYKNFPLWKDTSPLRIDNSIKLIFYFGSGEIYSGFEEVVKPVISIASAYGVHTAGNIAYGPTPTSAEFLAQFTVSMSNSLLNFAGNIIPTKYSDDNNQRTADKNTLKKQFSGVNAGAGVDDDGSVSEGLIWKNTREVGTSIETPEGKAATAEEEEAIRQYIYMYNGKKIYKTVDNAVDAVIDIREKAGKYNVAVTPSSNEEALVPTFEGKSVRSLIDFATKLESKFFDAFNSAMESASAHNTKYISLKCGTVSIINFIPKNVSYMFDMNNTDDLGYPLYGEVTFSDLQQVELASSSTIQSVMVKPADKDFVRDTWANDPTYGFPDDDDLVDFTKEKENTENAAGGGLLPP
jgi:hypothetical protein